MAASKFGRKLDPYRRLREPFGVKGVRQWVVNTHDPSTIDQNHNLIVKFPRLGVHDVILPGTARLAFTISLTSTDDNRTLVQNIGQAVISKTLIKIGSTEVMSISNSDIYHCYRDLWKTAQERENSQYQGIDTSNNQNVTKIRVNAGDAGRNSIHDAIADAYGNNFYIPLDFEMLESHMPFYQTGLQDTLQYELTFNKYSHVIKAQNDAKAKYTIDNIRLEYEIVTQQELSQLISRQYASSTVIYYDRVVLSDHKVKNKSEGIWNFDVHDGAKSMKGILILFQEPREDYQCNTETFYNPKITKVEVTIKGLPNQLYSHGLTTYQQWDEARKFLAAGCKRHPEVAMVAKDLGLADVSIGDYLTSKYALWLDLRSSDDDIIHGNGRRVDSGDTVKIKIEKKKEAAGELNVYIYAIIDAQINIKDGRFITAVY